MRKRVIERMVTEIIRKMIIAKSSICAWMLFLI